MLHPTFLTSDPRSAALRAIPAAYGAQRPLPEQPAESQPNLGRDSAPAGGPTGATGTARTLSFSALFCQGGRGAAAGQGPQSEAEPAPFHITLAAGPLAPAPGAPAAESPAGPGVSRMPPCLPDNVLTTHLWPRVMLCRCPFNVATVLVRGSVFRCFRLYMGKETDIWMPARGSQSFFTIDGNPTALLRRRYYIRHGQDGPLSVTAWLVTIHPGAVAAGCCKAGSLDAYIMEHMHSIKIARTLEINLDY